MTEVQNTWLYAVVPEGRLPPPETLGVAGETLRAVCGPGLTAVAGSVPRADFDEEPLRAHFEDIAWLERTVRAHHEVVDALAGTGPVLPMRFATLYRDDQRAAAMLHARSEELSAALEQIAGCTEWGVKVYLARLPAAPSPDDQATDEEHPGTAYLLRRRTRRQEHSEVLRRRADEARQVHGVLAATATRSTQHPVRTGEGSARSEPMVLNGAYLIDDSRLSGFENAVRSVAARHPALRVEVTGPWPPYSFSAVGADSEEG